LKNNKLVYLLLGEGVEKIKQAKGPQFIRFVRPVIEVLRETGRGF